MKYCILNVKLNGEESEILNLCGCNACIKNNSAGVIYASSDSGITIGAANVLPIQPGESAVLLNCENGLYLFGTGDAAVIGSDYTDNFFKAAPRSGGVTNGATEEYVNAQDAIMIASAKQYVAETINNPNLLINSDFRCVINQRGQAEYTASDTWLAPSYCVDRWLIMSHTAAAGNKVTVNDSSLTLSLAEGAWNRLYTFFENTISDTFTVTVKIKSATEGLRFDLLTMDNGAEAGIKGNILNGNEQIITATYNPDSVSAIILNVRNDYGYGSAEIEWVKLEIGNISTTLAPCDPATELARCQRYYQLHSNGNVAPVDLRPAMASQPVITQISEGIYAYQATDELNGVNS